MLFWNYRISNFISIIPIKWSLILNFQLLFLALTHKLLFLLHKSLLDKNEFVYKELKEPYNPEFHLHLICALDYQFLLFQNLSVLNIHFNQTLNFLVLYLCEKFYSDEYIKLLLLCMQSKILLVIKWTFEFIQCDISSLLLKEDPSLSKDYLCHETQIIYLL